MSEERTPQERAEALRIAADELYAKGYKSSAMTAHDVADELDPPRPKYEVGTWALVSWSHAGIRHRQALYRCWVHGWVVRPEDTNGACLDAEVTDVQPLPILPDGHVAVKRISMHDAQAEALSETADELRNSHQPLACRIVMAYSRALDAADD